MATRIRQVKRVDALIENLTTTIKQAPKTRRKTNMTHREVAGLKWCREKIRTRTLLNITRADKGGSIYTFDIETVSSIIENTLSDATKYSPLQDDPRKLIRSDLNTLLDSYIEEGTIRMNERFLITGKTEKGGQSYSHEFVMSKPHTYLPLV